MSRSLLDDAVAHHVWATLRSIDACLPVWAFGVQPGRVVQVPPTPSTR